MSPHAEQACASPSPRLPFLSVSTASGERADALPQAPECTDRTGLFKEAAGTDPSGDALKRSLFALVEEEREHILAQFVYLSQAGEVGVKINMYNIHINWSTEK